MTRYLSSLLCLLGLAVTSWMYLNLEGQVHLVNLATMGVVTALDLASLVFLRRSPSA